jgi:hypothetical protein
MKKFGGSWRARLNPWLGFKRKWKKEEDASLLEEQFTWTSFYNRSGLLAHGLFFICCIFSIHMIFLLLYIFVVKVQRSFIFKSLRRRLIFFCLVAVLLQIFVRHRLFSCLGVI